MPNGPRRDFWRAMYEMHYSKPKEKTTVMKLFGTIRDMRKIRGRNG
jgi:hypothetical protein